MAYIAALVVAFSLGGIAGAVWSRNKGGTISPVGIAQLVLVVVGIVGAVARALPVQHKADETFPVVDATTGGFLALIAVAIVLPRLRMLKAFGLELEADEAQTAEKAIDDYELAIDELASQGQNWTASLGIFNAKLSETADPERARQLLLNFLRDRQGEASVWISQDKSRPVRIATWLHVDDTDTLQFFYSNEIDEPTKTEYARGEGVLGQAFDEERVWNEPRATTLPSYKNTRGEKKPPYNAILLVPLKVHRHVLGMFSVDQEEEKLFEPSDVDVARGASNVCALAILSYYEWTNTVELPAPPGESEQIAMQAKPTTPPAGSDADQTDLPTSPKGDVPNLNVVIKRPAEFSTEELDSIRELIAGGAAVDLEGLAHLLPRCRSIAIATANSILVAVCGIKGVRKHYTSAIAQRADCSTLREDVPEFGYVATATEFRGRHVGSQVCEALLAVTDGPLYAVTFESNAAMIRILQNGGFTLAGSAWPSERRPGEVLRLWIRDF